jgi:hypothetical protein
MNGRIKHLAASHFPRDCNGDILTTPESIMDFAELIVRECIEISQVGSITEEKIKQHFGVNCD